jgi:hypothetical protein
MARLPRPDPDAVVFPGISKCFNYGGIARADQRLIQGTKCRLSRSNPVLARSQVLDIDQQLWLLLPQPVPVSGRLAIGTIDRIRAEVVCRNRIIFRGCKMAGPDP